MRLVAVGRKALLFLGSERAESRAGDLPFSDRVLQAEQGQPVDVPDLHPDNTRNGSLTRPTPDEFTASNIAHFGSCAL
jgi:hypothetical protein